MFESFYIFENSKLFQLKFNYELSYILIPLGCYLYLYYPQLRPYLFYHMVCIGIIGTKGTLDRVKYNGIITTIIGLLLHLILLLVLFDDEKYGKPNNVSVLLLLLANLTMIYIPYWPYLMSRIDMLIMYNLIFWLLYYNKIYK
jgi:hypothetical protein